MQPLQVAAAPVVYQTAAPLLYQQQAAPLLQPLALAPAYAVAPARVKPFAYSRSVLSTACKILKVGVAVGTAVGLQPQPVVAAGGGFAGPASYVQTGYQQAAAGYQLVHVGSTATTTTQVLHSYAAAPAPAPVVVQAPQQAPQQYAPAPAPAPCPVQASPQQAPRKGFLGLGR
jgi:hypothetical protein